MIITLMITPLYLKSASYLSDGMLKMELGPIYDLYMISLITVVIYAFYLLIRTFFHETGKLKAKIGYYFLATIFIPIALGNYIIGMVWSYPIRLDNFALMIYAAIVTYAITKHDLMDIPILISKTAANTLVAILISISTYLLYFFAKDIPNILLASGILVALFWFTYAKKLRYFIQTPLDKKFIKGWYDEHILLKEFLTGLATCKTYPDVIPVIDKALRDHMELTSIAIYFSTKLDDPTTPAENYLPIYTYPQKQHAIAHTLYIHVNAMPVAKINLGPKLSEDAFSKKDYDVFHTIEAQLSQTLDRIQQTQRYEIQRQEKQLAEAANHHKTRFLAQVCHDLRNPLHTVIGFSDYLKNHQEGEVEKIATMIHDSSQLLLQSIDDLIDIERIEKGDIPVHHELFCLQSLLEEISATMTLSLSQKPDVIFTLNTSNIPPKLTTDPRLLKRILMNLLTNAVKFTIKGSITLDISCNETALNFIVADTGCGFDQSKAEALFQPYAQEETDQKKLGVGLGLAIVQKLVHALKGSLTVESVPGEGTCFRGEISVG